MLNFGGRSCYSFFFFFSVCPWVLFGSLCAHMLFLLKDVETGSERQGDLPNITQLGSDQGRVKPSQFPKTFYFCPTPEREGEGGRKREGKERVNNDSHSPKGHHLAFPLGPSTLCLETPACFLGYHRMRRCWPPCHDLTGGSDPDQALPTAGSESWGTRPPGEASGAEGKSIYRPVQSSPT